MTSRATKGQMGGGIVEGSVVPPYNSHLTHRCHTLLVIIWRQGHDPGRSLRVLSSEPRDEAL